jgi:hypothetical protein
LNQLLAKDNGETCGLYLVIGDFVNLPFGYTELISIGGKGSEPILVKGWSKARRLSLITIWVFFDRFTKLRADK